MNIKKNSNLITIILMLAMISLQGFNTDELAIVKECSKDHKKCWLPGASLQEANLEGDDLSGANLTRANLRQANLRRSQLRWADLQGADLQGADLREANLEHAKLTRALINDSTQGDISLLMRLGAVYTGSIPPPAYNQSRLNRSGSWISYIFSMFSTSPNARRDQDVIPPAYHNHQPPAYVEPNNPPPTYIELMHCDDIH